MLRTYVGEGAFDAAINSYLKMFEFRNAETIDLWTAVAAKCDVDVARVMNGWTRLPGYVLA
jgi:aminopeptidase N